MNKADKIKPQTDKLETTEDPSNKSLAYCYIIPEAQTTPKSKENLETETPHSFPVIVYKFLDMEMVLF